MRINNKTVRDFRLLDGDQIQFLRTMYAKNLVSDTMTRKCNIADDQNHDKVNVRRPDPLYALREDCLRSIEYCQGIYTVQKITLPDVILTKRKAHSACGRNSMDLPSVPELIEVFESSFPCMNMDNMGMKAFIERSRLATMILLHVIPTVNQD